MDITYQSCIELYDKLKCIQIALLYIDDDMKNKLGDENEKLFIRLSIRFGMGFPNNKNLLITQSLFEYIKSICLTLCDEYNSMSIARKYFAFSNSQLYLTNTINILRPIINLDGKELIKLLNSYLISDLNNIVISYLLIIY